MKKVIFLLILASCGRIPQDQIVSDPQNLNKLSEIQSQLVNEKLTEAKNDAEYQECVNNVKKLHDINKKSSLSYNDYKELTKIFPDDEDYGYYRFGVGKYHDLSIKPLDCDIYISKYTYIDQLNDYCDEKYNQESTFTTIVAFPFRLTNGILTILTAGTIPYIHGAAYTNSKNCKSLSEKISDKGILPENVFSEEESENLQEKFKEYCDNNYFKSLKNIEKRFCSDHYQKGCLKDFTDYSVSTYGTRDIGVIVDSFDYNLDSQQYFIYDKSDYFDGQKVKNTEYYYEYVGIYNDTLQKLPAFKRSNTKKIQFNGHCEALNR